MAPRSWPRERSHGDPGCALEDKLVERFDRRKKMMALTGIQFFCFLLMTVMLYYTEKEGY